MVERIRATGQVRRLVTSWPPFPREIETLSAAAALRARFDASAAPLWGGSETRVPLIAFDEPVTAVLARAAREGALVVGLESVAAMLDREERGLSALAARESGSTRVTRVSRVLLVANDGAERFYRGVERVARAHATRLLVCRVDAPATVLGRAVLGREAGIKAVLLQRKPHVTALLRAAAGLAGDA